MSCDTTTKVCIKPSSVDLCFVRATTNVLEVVITEADGTSVNISLDTIKFTARDGLGGDVKLAKSNGPTEHLNDAEGKTEFTIEQTEIDDEVSSTINTYWYYEVRRVTPSGVENVHIQGKLTIMPDIGAP